MSSSNRGLVLWNVCNFRLPSYGRSRSRLRGPGPRANSRGFGFWEGRLSRSGSPRSRGARRSGVLFLDGVFSWRGQFCFELGGALARFSLRMCELGLWEAFFFYGECLGNSPASCSGFGFSHGFLRCLRGPRLLSRGRGVHHVLLEVSLHQLQTWSSWNFCLSDCLSWTLLSSLKFSHLLPSLFQVKS